MSVEHVPLNHSITQVVQDPVTKKDQACSRKCLGLKKEQSTESKYVSGDNIVKSPAGKKPHIYLHVCFFMFFFFLPVRYESRWYQEALLFGTNATCIQLAEK